MKLVVRFLWNKLNFYHTGIEDLNLYTVRLLAGLLLQGLTVQWFPVAVHCQLD